MKRTVKVAFLSTGLFLGGAETQLVRLAKNLDRTRWDLLVVTMLPPGEFGPVLEEAGIPVLSLEMRRGSAHPGHLWAMARILWKWRPSVLVCFMSQASLLGRIAGRMAGVPVIISSLRSERVGPPWLEAALRYSDWLGDMTTTNSSSVAKDLARRGIAPAGRLQVTPNGLPDEAFIPRSTERERIRRELRITDGEFLWLTVGRLDEPKDHRTLFQAFAAVAKNRPEARLLVAGAGSLRGELEERISALDLASRVSLLGQRKDVLDLLAGSDAFVLSSSWEGMPNALMEAMAAGRPVVATTVGGTPELVREGVSGYLVPPRSPEALARAMCQMMDLPSDTRLQMGKAGEAAMEERFSLASSLKTWEDLMLGLLEKKGLLARG